MWASAAPLITHMPSIKGVWFMHGKVRTLHESQIAFKFHFWVTRKYGQRTALSDCLWLVKFHYDPTDKKEGNKRRPRNEVTRD